MIYTIENDVYNHSSGHVSCVWMNANVALQIGFHFTLFIYLFIFMNAVQSVT